MDFAVLTAVLNQGMRPIISIADNATDAVVILAPEITRRWWLQ